MQKEVFLKRAATFRIGVDIGGTFTDIVLLGSDGSVKTKKVSSTPEDYGRGIVQGLQELLGEVSAQPTDVDSVVHATTVATNAVLEEKGAKTGLITTRGFRDILELRRVGIPVLYDLEYEHPKVLVPRRLRREVIERMGAKGEVRVALDETSVIEAATRLLEEGVEAVAICLINSYTNPAHERRTAELVREVMPPEVYVSCSYEILPEIREYERTSTVVVNALLGPVVGKYLTVLAQQLQEMGIRRPLQIMQSNGGLMSKKLVLTKPVAILESGPAAGVIAAARIAKQMGILDVITLDMGGTTAKTAMVEDGQPSKTTDYAVGAGFNAANKLSNNAGYAVKLPVIDISEIGSGGGSQVWIDKGGHVHVGPQSAGAVPGPVCYGLGGTQATLTDALVTLGYLNPDYLVGGALAIDAEKSRKAIQEQVAKPLDISLLEAAYGVYKISGSNMMRAVKSVSTYRGRDPRDCTLFAFGGNGPTLALEIAQLLEIKRILVPPSPGVFSAFGLLLSDAEHGAQRAMLGQLDQLSAEEVEQALIQLESEVGEAFYEEGYAPEEITVKHFADLRYREQGYELTMPVAAGAILLDQLAADFNAEHKRTYGHNHEDYPVELVNIRVVMSVAVHGSKDLDSQAFLVARGDTRRASDMRMAYFGSEIDSLETPVMSREDLVGRILEGPVIIEEYDATCAIPPGYTVTIDDAANIDIQLKKRKYVT